MLYQGRSNRRAAQVARSQFALRLGLAVYAAVCSLLALRLVVLVFGFAATVDTVSAIIALSEPIVLPLKLIPPANRTAVGSATLADLTSGIILLSAPLLFIGRRGPLPH